MSERCTWKSKDAARCTNEAKHPQLGNDRKQWANLCPEHHALLDSVIGVDPKKMLGYWVCAQGGAKAAAERMTR